MKNDSFPPWQSSTLLPLLAVSMLWMLPRSQAVEHRLELPAIGDHHLNVITPRVLELVRINTKQPNPATVDSWDWISQGNFTPPDLSSLQVVVNGQTIPITEIGFKRRPIYAGHWDWDLRIANHLYLRLGSPIPENQSVQVLHNGSLWPASMNFSTTTDPLRINPAIHVNQEGYHPSHPKKGNVGYYLGNLGELSLETNTFLIVNTATGATAAQGSLTLRQDFGYTYTPTPYQTVYEADFSGVTAEGEYQLVIPGMGASMPFRIDAGMAMNFARTFALGLFHQRSGFDVAMPFTRFTHTPDHMDPASIPTDASAPFAFTWETIANYASEVNPENPPQTAPRLTSPAAQLYPFTHGGTVEVSGGHFEAANYTKPVWNSAQVIHVLMFAVDSLPGVATLDNLGIPESGDGISDTLQEAKWEAEFLVKMQDADGGFYYMTYPQFREYEADVLPENGDPQVVWPKNTATTAAAVAALAQCASSPRMKQAFPEAANRYWTAALDGWRFITNAVAQHGTNGAYQRIMHFDDAFADRDDIAWAACELFAATGDSQYHDWLRAWFPDPTHPSTIRWDWWRMYASYGNAIRSYAGSIGSGRLQQWQLDANYLARCITTVTNCGNDQLKWSQENPYGSSFPNPTKQVRGAGWYFSSEQAFDLAVAYQFHANPAYIDAIVRNLNYEAGCNPVNRAYVTGLGWKRQRAIVDQYSMNDRRTLPKIGIPIGNIQKGFVWTFTYNNELAALCFPSDDWDSAPYPFYDRWADFFNVTTEASTTTITRGFATAAWLAAQTSTASQPWQFTAATITAPASARQVGQPVTVTLDVSEAGLDGARITWEARDQEPVFGNLTYTFTPVLQGSHWIEAEVHWPDGRRAFATNSVLISADAPPFLANARHDPAGTFSFRLIGIPFSTYTIEASADLSTWTSLGNHSLPADGVLEVAYPHPTEFFRRFYRAVKVP